MKEQGQIAAVSAQITSNKSRRSGHGRAAGATAEAAAEIRYGRGLRAAPSPGREEARAPGGARR